MQEDRDSVQFFKIKLMEKESEFTTLQAKLKKIEFKHSRDLKQVKISEERAKDLLKKQKAKLDKITEQAKKHQEQNSLLQHRLNELKEEKDKEIQNTRNKYNAIKQQVRSYERILPTHTFLTEIGAQIDQLPTYEDIFNNLKEKSFSFDNLTAKHEQFKQETQEKISLLEKNEEELSKKIAEKQTTIKEMLPRVVDLESQLTDYKYQLQDAATKILDMEEEVLSLKHKIQELQNENKDLKAEIQETIQSHNTQLQNKEQEIRHITESEFKRYEDQIADLNARSEIKEQSYMQQISIYEEEVHELQSRLQKQKQRHEENYQEIKEIMENLKVTLETDKRTISELENKNSSLHRDLLQSATAIQKLQLQLEQLKKDKEQAEHQLRQSQSQRDLDSTELNEKDLAKRQLEYRIEELMSELHKTAQQKRLREEENIALLTEIQDLKYRFENGSSIMGSGRLSLPQNVQMGEDEPIRRRKTTNFSIVQDTVNTVIEGFKSQDKLQRLEVDVLDTQSRSRKPSLAVSERYNQIKSIRAKNQQLQKQIQSKANLIKQLTKNVLQFEEKVKQLQNKLQQTNKSLESACSSLKSSEDRETNLKQQITELKTQISESNKTLKELQAQVEDLKSAESTSKKKQQASKTTIETLSGQISNLKADIKKEKEQKQALAQQIKDLKAKHQQQIANKDKAAKEVSQKMKQLSAKITFEQKSKADLVSKERNYQAQITSLKQEIQKANTKITQVQKKLASSHSKLDDAEKLNKQLKKNNQRLKHQVAQLQEDNKQKDREIEMINDSLERQRKQRTLITVPSLQSLHPDQEYQEEENFKEHYNTIGQKQAQIYMLQREVSNLKEELEELKLTHKTKVEDMETQQNEYVQEIIVMKLKVAESEMKAAEKEHLYNQLKKKLKTVENTLKQPSSTASTSKLPANK